MLIVGSIICGLLIISAFLALLDTPKRRPDEKHEKSWVEESGSGYQNESQASDIDSEVSLS